MDILPPPPPAIEYHLPIAYEKQDILIISVDHAHYDKTEHKAILDMNGAFEKSGDIMSHKGKEIALIYQGKMNNKNIDDCPNVHVPYTSIERNINFLKNTVTLTISNISQTLADKINISHCLKVDTHTVKKVVNPDFDKNPGSKVNR